ncbi:hypothetical protein HAX54_019272 [Datura stramonium]|uniref:Uncharacterized protein n=1 Tax=Datura stramonium TaxID=4076 RepID=A0ABS8S1N5_DATST|nr:hypothetical protein [Datura stramonium]
MRSSAASWALRTLEKEEVPGPSEGLSVENGFRLFLMEVTLLAGTSSARAFPAHLQELEAILLVGNYFVTVERFLEVGGDVRLPRFTVESKMSLGSFSPSSRSITFSG